MTPAVKGRLVSVKDRRNLLPPTSLPLHPRDAEGAPLQAVLTALSMGIGPEADRSRQALILIAGVWANRFGTGTPISAHAMHGQHIEATFSIDLLLAHRMARLGNGRRSGRLRYRERARADGAPPRGRDVPAPPRR
jgi:hypothetical protein